MKKVYQAPALEEVGGIAALTAAFGSDPRTDFNEFTNVRGTGSFDVCDSDTSNNTDPDFCGGED